MKKDRIGKITPPRSSKATAAKKRARSKPAPQRDGLGKLARELAKRFI